MWRISKNISEVLPCSGQQCLEDIVSCVGVSPTPGYFHGQSPAVWGYSPDPTASEHSGVDQVGTDQRHLDPVLLCGLQLVAEGLVKSNRTKLTGAVILAGREQRVKPYTQTLIRQRP